MSRFLCGISLALLLPVVSQAAPNESCPNSNPRRNAYFGDLHVHTAFSADAVGHDTVAGPDDAYRYPFDGWIMLPPLDADGHPTRRHETPRTLDFMAVTDHAEMLGEVGVCINEASVGYMSDACQAMRASVGTHPWQLVLPIVSPWPAHDGETCGDDDVHCTAERLRR